MKQFNRWILRCVALIVLSLSGAVALAGEWQLDPGASSVSFVSIKNGGIGESHGFDVVSGRVGAGGQVRIEIDLSSVRTGIPIRDERMQTLLFETGSHPTAVVTGLVDPLGRGHIEVAAVLELHGVSVPLELDLRVGEDTDGGVRVTSVAPVIVSAPDFGLGAGIERLREIAGLQRIATAVPVSLDLRFVPVAQGDASKSAHTGQ